MPNVPDDTTPNSNTDQAAPNSLAVAENRNSLVVAENSETACEALMKLISNDPQFILAKQSGKAFVILGAKP